MHLPAYEDGTDRVFQNVGIFHPAHQTVIHTEWQVPSVA